MNINKINIPFLLQASVASFGTYFCMYAFRKPFSVATFEGIQFFHIDYKILLIIAQVIGYAFSKFIGIKVISELKSSKRVYYLLALIGVSEIALLFFALVPAPYNLFFMFLNGVPLGMIWGIVFSYVEGRKYTEILGVILCSSFIVSSGMVKSVGYFIMNSWGISAFWMPAITGLIFIIPLCFFAWLLERIPPPTAEDKRMKMKRFTMGAKSRKQVLYHFFVPITVLVFFYMFLTAFRDFRDNFTRELWDDIGYTEDASIYTTSELLIAIVVLVLLGGTFYIKNNLRALHAYHGVLLTGVLCILITTWCFQSGVMSGFYWMVLSGFGLYSCYVPFNCLFFDRFIAAFKLKGNAGFLIYIADAFGYLGSVIVLLYKNFGHPNLSWTSFFIYGSYVVSGIGVIAVLGSYYLLNKKKHHQTKYSIGYPIEYTNLENINEYNY